MSAGTVAPDARALSELVDLSGRTAIVTGAGQGLGLAIAQRLSEAGAAVVMADLDGARAEAAAADLRGRGRTVTGTSADVTSRTDVEALVATAVREHGRVDVLVNNAGIYPQRPFLEADEAFWDTTFRVNMVGTMLPSQVVARRLIEQGGGGSIVNILSAVVLRASPDVVHAYAPSKAAMANFTILLARSLAPHGIRVNGVLPGAIETPGVEGLAKRADSDIPLGHRAHPDEVARGVLFLATDLAEYVTGSLLSVDGGFVLT